MTILDRFLENLNNHTVDLEEVLGPNYQTVLDFWTFLDSLYDTQRILKVNNLYCESERIFDREPYLNEQVAIFMGKSNQTNIELSLRRCSDVGATYEIILMDQIIANGEEFVFLPMYDGL